MVAKQDRCHLELDPNDRVLSDRLRRWWTNPVCSVTAWKHVSRCRHRDHRHHQLGRSHIWHTRLPLLRTVSGKY